MVIINSEKIPIKVWAHQEHLVGFEEAITQAKNLANHPISQKWVCLMSDFHIGFGMPIGGVLATQKGVVPNAVGVDIGCGMIAAQTSLQSSELTTEKLQEIRISIHSKIPVGMSHHKQKQSHELLTQAKIKNPPVASQLESADYQIGTLGGGNHFIEIQKDEQGLVWIMLHSGSRNLGHKVCNYYHDIAKAYVEKNKIEIPDMDLAFLSEDLPEYSMYLEAMEFCLKFAEASRQLMFEKVVESFKEHGINLNIIQQFDTHHNFAAPEEHFGEKYLIHRKGAVRAEGLVTIPGSMGTASYICEGLNPSESFNSCSHGAGRVLSRTQANQAITHEQAVEMMLGVVFGIKHGDYDEMPSAYKDIDQVINLQSDLVKPIYKLKPLAVVKG